MQKVMQNVLKVFFSLVLIAMLGLLFAACGESPKKENDSDKYQQNLDTLNTLTNALDFEKGYSFEGNVNFNLNFGTDTTASEADVDQTEDMPFVIPSIDAKVSGYVYVKKPLEGASRSINDLVLYGKVVANEQEQDQEGDVSGEDLTEETVLAEIFIKEGIVSYKVADEWKSVELINNLSTKQYDFVMQITSRVLENVTSLVNFANKQVADLITTQQTANGFTVTIGGDYTNTVNAISQTIADNFNQDKSVAETMDAIAAILSKNYANKSFSDALIKSVNEILYADKDHTPNTLKQAISRIDKFLANNGFRFKIKDIVDHFFNVVKDINLESESEDTSSSDAEPVEEEDENAGDKVVDTIKNLLSLMKTAKITDYDSLIETIGEMKINIFYSAISGMIPQEEGAESLGFSELGDAFENTLKNTSFKVVVNNLIQQAKNGMSLIFADPSEQQEGQEGTLDVNEGEDQDVIEAINIEKCSEVFKIFADKNGNLTGISEELVVKTEGFNLTAAANLSISKLESTENLYVPEIVH